MLDTVAKNLWLLLTLVIPGLFTYGAWRLLLLLEPSSRLDVEALKQIDGSGLTSTSVIIAIALLQQPFLVCLMQCGRLRNVKRATISPSSSRPTFTYSVVTTRALLHR